ncbi:MAG: class I SAM-dependent methyltransferase [Pseudomonadota bacterium]
MANEEQKDYWNGDAGRRWAEEDAVMSRLLEPVSSKLMEHAQLRDYEHALDIGCGGGSQSLALAKRLGSGASVLGIDISEPLLGLAQTKKESRAEDCAELDFLLADAAVHAFAQDSFDLLFSRFGVMFFEDPIAAFTNLRSACMPGAALAFCCWQAMPLNDWLRIPIECALQYLPPPERPDPHAPGPFAFADKDRLEGILSTAGFSDIAVQPFSPTLRFHDSGSVEEAVGHLVRIGPLGVLLKDQPEDLLQEVYPALESVLAPYFQDGALQMDTAIWLVTGKAD